jgi:bacillithiol biosynthesis cysteine-adding enzyme BshC
MHTDSFSYNELNQLSFKDKTYQLEYTRLKDFIAYSPNINGLLKAIDERKRFQVDRKLLVKEIKRQYSDSVLSKALADNIESLNNEDTFTIITAHQPSLFTGPLYYIYKIFSAINLAEEMSQKSGKTIVPVFINGSEDHDFEEINHTYLYGKKVEWSNNQGGPVGRLSLNAIAETIAEIEQILGDKPKSKAFVASLKKSLSASKNYNEFVFHTLHDLFNEYGLIVVNMDNTAFKTCFSAIMEKELINPVAKDLVNKTQASLSEISFSDQAFARDINLFYINEHGRNRIEKIDNDYHIVDTDIIFSKSALLQELKNNPISFSPNVILRPLYQEMIFPNIAYVGGGGEIAYWVERKSLFDYYNVFFPTLIRRNSAMIIPAHIQKNMDKLNVRLEELLDNEDTVIKNYVYKNAGIELDFSSEKSEIENLFQTIAEKAESIDPTLKASILGEATSQIKKIDQIEARIRKAVKQKEETQIKQLIKIYQYLFPNQGLQERQANMLEFFTNEDFDFFKILKEELHPLQKEFKAIYL